MFVKKRFWTRYRVSETRKNLEHCIRCSLDRTTTTLGGIIKGLFHHQPKKHYLLSFDSDRLISIRPQASWVIIQIVTPTHLGIRLDRKWTAQIHRSLNSRSILKWLVFNCLEGRIGSYKVTERFGICRKLIRMGEISNNGQNNPKLCDLTIFIAIWTIFSNVPVTEYGNFWPSE